MPRVKLNKTEYTQNRFSDLVRGELHRQKVKTQELADYIGRTPQALNRMISGSTTWTLPIMAEVADYLNISFTIGETK